MRAHHRPPRLRRPGRCDRQNRDLTHACERRQDRITAGQPGRTGSLRSRDGHGGGRYRTRGPLRRHRLRSARRRRVRACGALPDRRGDRRRACPRRRRHEPRRYRREREAQPGVCRRVRRAVRHRPARPRRYPRSGSRHGRHPRCVARREDDLPGLLVRHSVGHGVRRDVPRPGPCPRPRRRARPRAGTRR